MALHGCCFENPAHGYTVMMPQRQALFGLACRKAAVKPAKPVLAAARYAQSAALQRAPPDGGCKR
ncbi:hypothetical protein D3Z39_15960 [Anaerotruncus colihominis]|uniref:Uncharacterized protein n=1 Tax=Anaerotruncus colihominis TaxID=169435 RepID=A0A845RND9_9FIRM|nr:hypothetical protein [Anaerotruncus colihominis]